MLSRLAISTMSLGRCWAGHSFEHKLDMAAKYSYHGIEVWHEDLMDLADRYPDGGATNIANQLAAAQYLRQLCAARNLHILCLQPFQHYEGLLDRDLHARRVDEMRVWMQLASALGTDLIHIASNVLPQDQVSADMSLHVSDLRELADLGAQQDQTIRLSYEALAWGARVDTWEQSWEIVQAVDRDNFGLCLDTFNIAGRIFADPSSRTGCTPDAEEAVHRSIERLVETVDVSRLFFVQVVDAERLREPLVPGHAFYDASMPARMAWSRNCRLFYGEQTGYLPVREIATAIFQGLGFEGWVSLELFNRRMSQEDKEVPEELARRGAISWGKLVRDTKLRVEEPPYAAATASL
jgi:3-dehydroshikimate dehydratase